MHPVDPGAGQIRERREVRLGGQPLGLEAAHLAGRGRRPVDALPADDGAHRRIAGEPLGVVDVFVAGEPAVDRLAQQAQQPVANVLSTPPLGEGRSGHRGQAEHVVQLAVGEQAAVRGDPRPVELELDPAVEGDPSGGSLASPVASAIPAHPSRSIVLKFYAESAPLVTEMPTVIVESRTGAVAWAMSASPRFPSPLIKPDVRISRIRLSDWLHLEAHGMAPR